MDDSIEDSGGKLEVDSIYYFGQCVLAGRWHGQRPSNMACLLEGPEPWNGQKVCWCEGSMPSGHKDWWDDGDNSLYISDRQDDVPSPRCGGDTKPQC